MEIEALILAVLSRAARVNIERANLPASKPGLYCQGHELGTVVTPKDAGAV